MKMLRQGVMALGAGAFSTRIPGRRAVLDRASAVLEDAMSQLGSG